MNKLANGIALLALASTAVWAVPAFAQMGKANSGNGEQPRSAPGGVEISRDAKPIAVPKVEDGES